MKAKILVRNNRVLPPRIACCALAVLVVFNSLFVVVSIDFAQPSQHPFSRLAEGYGSLNVMVKTGHLKHALQLVGYAI
jgi:hypothetical protein